MHSSCVWIRAKSVSVLISIAKFDISSVITSSKDTGLLVLTDCVDSTTCGETSAGLSDVLMAFCIFLYVQTGHVVLPSNLNRGDLQTTQ